MAGSPKPEGGQGPVGGARDGSLAGAGQRRGGCVLELELTSSLCAAPPPASPPSGDAVSLTAAAVRTTPLHMDILYCTGEKLQLDPGSALFFSRIIPRGSS
jgi:hypothetical protein